MREIALSLFKWLPGSTPLTKKEITESGLFDGEWYLGRYPDVSIAGKNALDHFHRHGIFEGRDPGPLFDSTVYNATYLDVAHSKYPAFVHFVKMGRREGRNPHPLFDVAYYKSQSNSVLEDGFDAIDHYLSGGWKEGWKPNVYFDSLIYAKVNSIEEESATPPLLHYAKNGHNPTVSLLPFFAQNFYLDRYPRVGIDWTHTPLQHYIQYGRDEGFACLPDIAWADDFYAWSDIKDKIEEVFSVENIEDIDVSVVIPVYNEFYYTLRCVNSIIKASDRANIEIIIADDCSADETQAFFSKIPHIKYIRNPENLGFLRSCNSAAATARGKYIYFLNNDTAVLPGWLDSILSTFENISSVGLIGSKLVYPNGFLQESGGFVWKDGTGANVGRYGDRSEPGYNFLREVDYVSGAGIMVPKNVWQLLGGFCESYVPAYCEDSDFCIRLKQNGYRVLVQPASEIIHFEGISSGTSLQSGVKAYQVVNQQKLFDTWKYNLELHGEPQSVNPRNLMTENRPSILIIDTIIPETNKDAGSVTAFFFMKLLVDIGYHVTFIPTNLANNQEYTSNLQEIGVEVLYQPYIYDIQIYIEEYGDRYCLFLLYRVNDGGSFFDFIKSKFPETPVIFDTVDLHYVREMQQAELPGANEQEIAMAQNTKLRELSLIRRANDTIVLSNTELVKLRKEGISRPISLIPLVLDVPDKHPKREGRSGIVFIGGYRHKPNVDAVLYFVEMIWPLVKESIPELEFHVVGSNPPKEILELSDVPGVIVHGFVEGLDALLDEMVMSIAPLRYGAGIKGKIGTSLANGLPCIASSVAVEGMGLTPDHNVLVADQPKDFAKKIKSLLKNKRLWTTLSKNGRSFVIENYSFDRIGKKLKSLLAKSGVAPFSGICPIGGEQTMRRFYDKRDLDSLQDDIRFANSSDRVIASYLLEYWGQTKPSLSMISYENVDNFPSVKFFGEAAVVRNYLKSKNVRESDGGLLAGTIAMDNFSDKILRSIFKSAPNAHTVCIAVKQTVDSKNRIPEIVEFLVSSDWQVRTRPIYLPECALTKTILVEGKKSQ